MVKSDTTGQTDAEQAFWLDGGLIGRFAGIRWRDTGTLKRNCFWPSMYIHNSPQTNRVWMGDRVVAITSLPMAARMVLPPPQYRRTTTCMIGIGSVKRIVQPA